MTQRRFNPPKSRLALGWVGIAIVLAASYWFSETPNPPVEPLPEGEAVKVDRVVDGDTLIIAGDRFRLIGVNAPESVRPDYPVEPFGPEASEFTKEFVARGDISLTFDKERVDRFGRKLAYVWSGKQLLNLELIEQGLARFEPHFYYSESMKGKFGKAQDRAKAAHLGIWSLPREKQRTDRDLKN